MAGARVLYLSYDGMCDPLGRSQVLPYLIGLAARGHKISLISFEKPNRSASERAEISRACGDACIDWYPLAYHKRPPVFSTLYDVVKMSRLAAILHREQQFQLVHCRSYIAALVGLRMKRRADVPFVFDMRGFWADERVDGGIWRLSNPLFRIVYRYFKRREREFLDEADHIVSLTEAGRAILRARRGGAIDGPPITVIPCCVDFDAFPPVSEKARIAARRELGISERGTVPVYLGSFGSWYMIDEMMSFFRIQLERDPISNFLVLTHEPRDKVLAVAERQNIPEYRLIIRAASRDEVPKFAAAANYAIFFIKPVFSKTASSPTKLAEFLALEIPMITNSGVGDVDSTLKDTGAGFAVERFEDESYRAALDHLLKFTPEMARWRATARRLFDLETGVKRYDAIYREIAVNS